ncbi:Prolipoprotein diacylglyceryl transferase [Methylacidimicrobium sp. AP8]|uniref:prolipoprotein diacylglyceryl transferase n=1 Tax=Methylacidimicrobium sp. AP8 TaxID=2730359 RepID=UPI0018C0DD2C|nr:prolipoprotein diacylglyceryl transferase [Methylacidimicrobium sp. AP8]CAB4244407.1 Prolipoprotein diacylglyceryl transferase [Methylacidimicrobium sp. AP8]
MLAFYVDNLSPYLLRFPGGWGIRYYGLAYLLGFLFLWWGLHYQRKKGWLRLTDRQIDDFVFWLAMAGVIAGGRLGYCLLYDLPHILRRPLDLFALWQGGMSSHGGIVGVLIVLFWSARRYRLPFFHLADAVCWCTPVGLGLGRIANFLNGELWGRPSTVPWAVIFPEAPLVHGQAVPRHPSQLYEAALEGLLLFALLTGLRAGGAREGTVALCFLAGYSVVRIVAECFREPDVQIGFYFGFLTQGQILSGITLAVAGLLWELRRRGRL